MSGINAAGARLTLLLAAVAGPAFAADDLATPPFPANLQHEVVTRWINSSTDLPRGAPLVFGSDAVAAILTNGQKGNDRQIRNVSFREEATAANFVTRMGGRSISGDADVDCRARSIKLNELTIYAGSNLRGREISHMGARTDWRVPTPDRVLSRVVSGACGAAKPLPAAAPAAGLKPAVPAPQPTPSEPPPQKPATVAVAKPAPPPPKPATPAPVRPAAGPPPVLAARPAPAPARPAPPAVVAKAPATPPPPAKPAPAPVAVATADGGVRVQIGAVSSAAIASSEWDRVARQFPDAFKGRSKSTMKVDANGAELHRVLVGGFASKGAAQSFCGVLQAKGQACFIRN
jgi:hypothetical protein